jgi:hypothetical protein
VHHIVLCITLLHFALRCRIVGYIVVCVLNCAGRYLPAPVDGCLCVKLVRVSDGNPGMCIDWMGLR